MDYSTIIHYLPIILIPFVSGFVGWITNVIALKMTFYPLEFKGIQPFLGWQGIIPSKATKMATISVNLMTSKLIRVEDVFERIDPKIASQLISPSIQETAHQLIDEIMLAQVPLLWKTMPKVGKEEIYNRVYSEIPAAVENMMQDMKDNIVDLLDLRKLVIDVLLDDKNLINEIFLNVGDKEFKFIEHSGFYFGFLFGLIQMVIFIFYDPWWILPVFGIIVGYATNWLAIKLIFSPVKPIGIGRFKIQGIFIKRQEQVAAEYAKIIEQKILTTERLFNYILRGPKAQNFGKIIKKYTDQAIQNAMSEPAELYNLVAGKKIEASKNIALFRMRQEFPIAIKNMYNYAQNVLQIEHTLHSKMAALSEIEFVEFLRPVFQEDEFKLILVGAVLGGLAGLLQYFVFFY
jgi:uncharacterized membrane protein YheB (UPF0754 family)